MPTPAILSTTGTDLRSIEPNRAKEVPSSVNTIPKPHTNAIDARNVMSRASRYLRSATGNAVTYERKLGIKGKQQGEVNEISPATKAKSGRSTTDIRHSVVDETTIQLVGGEAIQISSSDWPLKVRNTFGSPTS